MAGEAIRFNASLNTAGFDSGAKNLQNLAANASAGITRHFGKIAAAVVGIGAAFIGVRAAVQAFNAAVAMGGQLNDLSARTGETAGNLALLQRAFENAGAGADAVGPTINRLQRAIVEAGQGGKQQAEAFAKLGLNLERLKDLTPTEQLQAVAGALQGVGNDSERGAIAMQLLGRSGGELLPLLRAMGVELDVARGQLGSLPGVIDKTNGHLDRIGDNFAAIGEKGKEFMVGLLERLGPALADLTDRLANIDAAGFGAKLSEYAEKTVAWITETFRLGEALKNIEVAIGGITSGNFGDGLKLMFLTARDTALNAINNIVAAASAAAETIGNAVSKMFRADGPLLHLLKTSFTIGANYFKEVLMTAMASVLENFGPWGKKIAGVMRYEAETAARSIEMLTKGIGAQVDLVGDDAKATFAAIPAEFAKSYKANMENPLFEMKDRAAETADQMERVATATRAAAFDAEKFGQALRDAQVDRLAGDYADSPFPKNTRGGGTKTPPQNTSDRLNNNFHNDAAKHAPRGGGSSRPTPTRDQTVAQMRADAASERATRRVGEFMDRGAFGSAAAAMERGDRRANRILQDQRGRDVMGDLFGAKNIGDSLRNFERDARKAGMTPDEALKRMGIDREVGEDRADALKRFVEDQAKTPEERKAEEEAMRDKHAPKGGAAEKDLLSKIHGILETHMKSIDDKLPQHALAA
jgi:hypothetical protein